VTFRDLQKLIESNQSQSQSPEQTKAFQRLRDKKFWHWDKVSHQEAEKKNRGDCCFNHIIGLPRKDGIEKPMFDYEREIHWALTRPGYYNSYPSINKSNIHIKPNNILYSFKEKHLWIKKTTGLGVTEFMLRFMSWLCVYNANDNVGSISLLYLT
jgi:hypothetical protein